MPLRGEDLGSFQKKGSSNWCGTSSCADEFSLGRKECRGRLVIQVTFSRAKDCFRTPIRWKILQLVSGWKTSQAPLYLKNVEAS